MHFSNDGRSGINSNYFNHFVTTTPQNRIPRFSGNGENDFTTDASSPYVKGVLGISFPFIIMGIKILLLIPLKYCCKSCWGKCCKRCRDEPNTKKPSACKKIMFCMFLLFIVVGSAIGYQANDEIVDAIDSLSSGVNRVDTVLNGANTIGTAIVGNLDNMITDTDAFKAQSSCPNANAESETDRYLTTMASDMGDAKMSTEGYISSTDNFVSIMSEFDQFIVDYEERISQGTLALLSLGLICALLSFCALMFTNCATDGKGCCSYLSSFFGIIVGPFSIIVLFILFVVGGLSIAISTFSADFCMHPDENALTLAPISSDPQTGWENYQLVEFYTTCQGDNILDDKIDDSASMVDDVRSALTSWKSRFDDLGCTGADSFMNSMTNSLDQIDGSFDNMADKITCENINPIYRDFVYDALCTSTVNALVLLWVGVLVSAFFLLLVVGSYKKIASPEAYRIEKPEEEEEKKPESIEMKSRV